MVFEPPTIFTFMMSCAGDVVDRKALSIETRYANHGQWIATKTLLNGRLSVSTHTHFSRKLKIFHKIFH